MRLDLRCKHRTRKYLTSHTVVLLFLCSHVYMYNANFSGDKAIVIIYEPDKPRANKVSKIPRVFSDNLYESIHNLSLLIRTQCAKMSAGGM